MRVGIKKNIFLVTVLRHILRLTWIACKNQLATFSWQKTHTHTFFFTFYVKRFFVLYLIVHVNIEDFWNKIFKMNLQKLIFYVRRKFDNCLNMFKYKNCLICSWILCFIFNTFSIDQQNSIICERFCSFSKHVFLHLDFKNS